MNLTVFGATGPTGRHILGQALTRGHRVTAVARHPQDLAPHAAPGLNVVQADLTNPGSDLSHAIAGADAVLSALGSRGRTSTTVYSTGTRRIAESMARNDVKRLICVSSDGIDVPAGLPWPQRLVMTQIIQRLYRNQYTDMAKMEAYLLRCAIDGDALDWTIVRAPRLTDGPSLGTPRESLDTAILDATGLRRAGLAGWMLDAINRPDTIHHNAHLADPRKKRRA